MIRANRFTRIALRIARATEDVCLEFSILCNMKASLIPITVKSQAALSSSQKKKVEDALADGLNSPLKNLNIGYEVDTDILAGVRVVSLAHHSFMPIGPLWGGKTGSICHFAFSLVLQCLGVPRYPDAGKNSTKSAIVTPLFVCPEC